MIWNEYPEVRLAQRVFKKHSLSLPVKIDSLLKLYATVIFDSIPITGVDGIAVNIKVPGKVPVVFINVDTTDTRQRFTMAHELGHLVIPWHTGINERSMTSEVSYSEIEKEANRFAAELLMPNTYIKSIAIKSDNLAKAHKEVCKRLNVSPLAAATHIINTFPPGLIYSAIEENVVVHSRKTEGTSATVPPRNQVFNEDIYPSPVKKSFCKFNDTVFCWWEMTPFLSADEVQNTPAWRQLLSEMVSFLDSEHEREKYKRSINGIISSINGKKCRDDNYSLETLLAACYERFDREEHSQLRNHPFFDNFLKLRLGEFLERSEGYNQL